MPIICWGNLAKSADDTTRIEQAIEDYIESHDANPNAHMGEDYSLGAHRLSVEIDHLPYSIRNKLLYPQSRTYKAVVDLAGYGDETDIQKAIDFVHSLGGGAVFIKAGTYNISSNLVLYSNIQLIGEDDDTTILNFGNSTAQVLIRGVSGSYKRNVLLQNLNFTNGKNKDGLIQIAYVDNVTIRNCKFTHSNASTTTLHDFIHCYTGSSRIFIHQNRFLSGPNFIALGPVSKCWIIENYFYNSQRDAILGGGGSHIIIRNNVFENIRQNSFYEGPIFFEENIINLHIEGNQFINCRGTIIFLSNMTRVIINDNRVDGSANTNVGIYLSTCNRCVITGNNLDDFNYEGIYVEASDKNVIVGNCVTNCGTYGVNISDAYCNKNVVVGNVLTNNTSGGLRNAGTGTVAGYNAT